MVKPTHTAAAAAAAPAVPPPAPVEAHQVLLYVPNLIGYVRLLLLLAAAACSNQWGSICCYLASQLLDAADGHAARMLKQVSVFGACLDQLLDRISTCLLYISNATAFPQYSAVFFLLLLTDMGGHWLHFFAAAAAGAASHKQVSGAPLVLQWYYTSKALMLLSIVSYEGILVSLLLVASATPGSLIYNGASACALVCLPLAVFKGITNVLQGYYGAWRLASLSPPSASS